MLRIVRIALFALVPTLALALSVAACSDDTTNQMVQDMAVTPVHDLSTTPVLDLAQPGD